MNESGENGRMEIRTPTQWARERNFIMFRMRGIEGFLRYLQEHPVVTRDEQREIRKLIVQFRDFIDRFGSPEALAASKTMFLGDK